jgi:thioredoxin reductase
LVDDLPDLPGLREGWGKGVLHCPYCHGYEVAGRRLGVLAIMPQATHQVNLIPEWGPATFLTNGVVTLTATERAALSARGVAVEEGLVAAILNEGEGLAGVSLRDGRTFALDALFTGVPTRQASPLAEQLGCALEETMLGPIVGVDATGQTSVPGVFAAGDAALPMKSLPGAVASGYTVGVAAHRSLLPPMN